MNQDQMQLTNWYMINSLKFLVVTNILGLASMIEILKGTLFSQVVEKELPHSIGVQVNQTILVMKTVFISILRNGMMTSAPKKNASSVKSFHKHK